MLWPLVVNYVDRRRSSAASSNHSTSEKTLVNAAQTAKFHTAKGSIDANETTVSGGCPLANKKKQEEDENGNGFRFDLEASPVRKNILQTVDVDVTFDRALSQDSSSEEVIPRALVGSAVYAQNLV